jgi:hypothetical protein
MSKREEVELTLTYLRAQCETMVFSTLAGSIYTTPPDKADVEMMSRLNVNRHLYMTSDDCSFDVENEPDWPINQTSF